MQSKCLRHLRDLERLFARRYDCRSGRRQHRRIQSIVVCQGHLQHRDHNDIAALDKTIANAYETQQIPDWSYLQERGMDAPALDTGRDTGRTHDGGGGRDH
jgi:hypothetical protein